MSRASSIFLTLIRLLNEQARGGGEKREREDLFFFLFPQSCSLILLDSR